MCSTSSNSLEYPLALRAAAIVLFAMGGSLVAAGLSSALGDATWSLSTGLGSCLVAGIYEVGRPDRLSADEANQLDEQYQDFGKRLRLSCPFLCIASLPESSRYMLITGAITHPLSCRPEDLKSKLV